MIGALLDTWYVAAHGHEIGRRPLGRSILGTKLVLFRDQRRVVHAIPAECPHRGADLSRGRVVRGHLQCPYHGWQFAGSGRCVRIPSQVRVPERAHIPARHVVEAQGIVWIWGGGQAPPRDPPRYEFWEPARARARTMVGPTLVRAPFVHVMEQSIDASHAPFTHGRSLGLGLELAESSRPDDKKRPDVHLDEETGTLWWRDDIPGFADKNRLHRLAQELRIGRILSREVRFELGGQVYARYRYGKGHWDVSMIQVCPADETSVWVYGDVTRTHGRHPLARLMKRRFLARMLKEDSDTMSSLLRHDHPESMPSGVSVEGDYEPLLFRKWYRRALELQNHRSPESR